MWHSIEAARLQSWMESIPLMSYVWYHAHYRLPDRTGWLGNFASPLFSLEIELHPNKDCSLEQQRSGCTCQKYDLMRGRVWCSGQVHPCTLSRRRLSQFVIIAHLNRVPVLFTCDQLTVLFTCDSKVRPQGPQAGLPSSGHKYQPAEQNLHSCLSLLSVQRSISFQQYSKKWKRLKLSSLQMDSVTSCVDTNQCICMSHFHVTIWTPTSVFYICLTDYWHQSSMYSFMDC